ncbi:MAG: sulfatase-like hydrolase/transferase [Bacteroidales bacterium]|nr:sulfatase-like hydrolase/transferase [Bacteroidales bacterium]
MNGKEYDIPKSKKGVLVGAKGLLLIFFSFFMVMFITNLMFHYFCFGYIAFSSLWSNTAEFFAFYFSKMCIPLFIASFVLLTKRQWWTIIVLFLICLWYVANIIYFRANGFFLDFETIGMAGNMSGFWGAVVTYINWKTYIFLFLLLLYCLAYIFFFRKCREERSLKFFVIAILLSIFMFAYDFVLGYGNKRDTYCQNQFQRAVSLGNGTCPYSCLTEPSFVEKGTLLHYFPSYIIYRIVYAISENDRNNYVPHYTLREKQILDSIVNIDSVETQVSVRSNLVLIIVESLESWVIGAVDEKGNPVAPVLSGMVDDSNVLYVSKVRSQVKQGNSGDGQMIVNTGLLPLFSGAACMIYGGGTYPNFAHLYNESIIVDACGNRAWNQPVMTERYGYKSITTASADEDYKNDEETMGLAIAYLDSLTEPYCMQIITYSTHAPFTQVDTKGLFLHKDMPSNLQNYMQSVHYADSCIGLLLKKMESDSLFRNTSLVITGDHTFFKKQMLNEYQSFVQKHTDNYPIPAEESFCPLIVCSPAIKKSMVVNDLCYQMDIFPTILQCIGADDYYWKGFGENLIDSVALNNRRLVEDEASLLSDKMIRSDYFGSYWRKQ